MQVNDSSESGQNRPDRRLDIRLKPHLFGEVLIFRCYAIVVIFGLIAGMLLLSQKQSTRDSAQKGAHPEALRDYVMRSPFDAAGHLTMAAEGAHSDHAPTPQTTLALAAAATLAPYDPDVLRIATLRRLQLGDADGAIAAGERLTAVDPSARADVVKALWSLRTTASWQKTVERWTQSQSPLLDELVFAVCQSDTQIAQKVQLATLASAANLLSNRSFECLYNASLRSAEFADVYSLWIERLARKQIGEPLVIPNVFNGDFSRAIDSDPFDWKLGSGGDFRDGYIVRIRRESASGAANRFLDVELNGRPVKTEIASIATALPRGRFALSYRIRDSSQTAGHRFRLSLRCISGAELTNAASEKLGPQGTGGDWVLSSSVLTVPDNCFAQRLTLESTRPGWKALGASGRVAIDDVVISSSGDAQ